MQALQVGGNVRPQGSQKTLGSSGGLKQYGAVSGFLPKIFGFMVALLASRLIARGIFGDNGSVWNLYPTSRVADGVIWVDLGADREESRNDIIVEGVLEAKRRQGFAVGLCIYCQDSACPHEVVKLVDFFLAVARNERFAAAVILTINDHAHYSASHALIDVAVDSLDGSSLELTHSVHSFGKIPVDRAKAVAMECVLGSEQASKCPRVVETHEQVVENINENIRLEIKQSLESSSFNFVDNENELIESIPVHEQSGPVKPKFEHQHGKLKSVFIFISRLIGFVYPFHETWKCVKFKKSQLHEWGPYWLVSAMLHVLEDLLFIRLLYLFPVYFVVKITFLAWCSFPNPVNSEKAYNDFVHFIGKNSRTKMVK